MCITLSDCVAISHHSHPRHIHRPALRCGVARCAQHQRCRLLYGWPHDASPCGGCGNGGCCDVGSDIYLGARQRGGRWILLSANHTRLRRGLHRHRLPPHTAILSSGRGVAIRIPRPALQYRCAPYGCVDVLHLEDTVGLAARLCHLRGVAGTPLRPLPHTLCAQCRPYDDPRVALHASWWREVGGLGRDTQDDAYGGERSTMYRICYQRIGFQYRRGTIGHQCERLLDHTLRGRPTR